LDRKVNYMKKFQCFLDSSLTDWDIQHYDAMRFIKLSSFIIIIIIIIIISLLLDLR